MKALSQKPTIVIVQLEISQPAALEALKIGKELRAMTIFNPAPAPSEKLDDAFYKYSDVVIPNETELKELTDHDFEGSEDTEEARAQHLLQKGVGKAVIVTLGARGAMVVHKDGSKPEIVSAPKDLPANELPVMDTVGAGDSFCGSLSAYLTAGLSLEEAAGYACGVASMSVRKKGAQTSYPSYEELPDSLKIKEKVST
jgi:ribokinase